MNIETGMVDLMGKTPEVYVANDVGFGTGMFLLVCCKSGKVKNLRIMTLRTSRDYWKRIPRVRKL